MKPNNNGLYANQDLRWDTIIGQISFLGKLKRAREDYEKTIGEYNVNGFLLWLHDVYGVTVIVRDGDLTSDYEVVDEQKFLLFELKYTV